MPHLTRGASRSRRYAASAALLASGAAVFACGSTETAGNAGNSAGAGNNSSAGLGGEAAGGEAAGGDGSGGTDGGDGNVGGTEAGGMSSGGSAGAATTGRACPGHEEMGECRTAADCTSMSGRRTYCSHAPAGTGCGNPAFEPQCPIDGCGDGMVCVPFGVCGGHLCELECSEVTCTGTDHCVDGVCQPKPCDADGASPCPDGYVCDPEAGDNPRGCLPVSCAEDPERCEPWQSCEPGILGGDVFDCRIKSCVADGDCGECGYCVNQNCSPTLANCYEEQPAMPYGCVWPDEELV